MRMWELSFLIFYFNIFHGFLLIGYRLGYRQHSIKVSQYRTCACIGLESSMGYISVVK